MAKSFHVLLLPMIISQLGHTGILPILTGISLKNYEKEVYMKWNHVKSVIKGLCAMVVVPLQLLRIVAIFMMDNAEYGTAHIY